MSFPDKELNCSDCGAAFTFGAGEPECFPSKALPMGLSFVPHAVVPAKRGVPIAAGTVPYT